MYHSHTNEVADTYAGLMGAITVTRPENARPDGSPKDVDREVFGMWSVMDENSSPYIQANTGRFAEVRASWLVQGGSLAVWHALTRAPAQEPKAADLLDDPDFQESNLMHAFNGYVYSTGPVIGMCLNSRVRWCDFHISADRVGTQSVVAQPGSNLARADPSVPGTSWPWARRSTCIPLIGTAMSSLS